MDMPEKSKRKKKPAGGDTIWVQRLLFIVFPLIAIVLLWVLTLTIFDTYSHAPSATDMTISAIETSASCCGHGSMQLTVTSEKDEAAASARNFSFWLPKRQDH